MKSSTPIHDIDSEVQNALPLASTRSEAPLVYEVIQSVFYIPIEWKFLIICEFNSIKETFEKELSNDRQA